MNRKEVVLSCICLIIAAALFIASVVLLVRTCVAYDKKHDELLSKNILGSRLATKSRGEEPKNSKIVKYYRDEREEFRKAMWD